MYSSPARTSARKRHGPGATESVRSSRLSYTPAVGRSSTPHLAVAERTPAARSARGNSRAGWATGSNFGDDSSVLSESVRFERRKGKSRSTAGELEAGTILSRDDNHSVRFYARLPNEARAHLQSSSVYDATSSSLDPASGFAYLILRTKCFVWSYLSSAAYESPICFAYDLTTFTNASSSSSLHELARCAFVPKGVDREPGILLVSPHGSLYYGDSVSNALDVEQSTKSGALVELGFGSGEKALELHRCTPNSFVLSTTHARLIGIRLTSSGGQLRPMVSVFAQPKGIFGRIFGAAATLTNLQQAGIVALASNVAVEGTRGGNATEVFALSQQSVQKWSLTEGRGERMLFEQDVRPDLLNQDERISEGSHSSETLKLVDAVLTQSKSLLILYSFAAFNDGPLHYGLATLSSTGAVDEARITSVSALAYNRATDPRSHSQPKLMLPHGGPIAFIIFSEAIIFRHIHIQGGLEESIEMRDVASNRIIGAALSVSEADIAGTFVVTQQSGILLVDVNTSSTTQISELIASGENRMVVETHRLKTKLERGVFHTDNALNPISFDLPADVLGDLVAASEQLSDDIVRSESPSLTETVDVRAQIANRLERLHSLAMFLSLNGMMASVSQNCLRRLCADAQLLAASMDLWDYVNELLSSPDRSQAARNLFVDAVRSIEKADDSADSLRHFFRYNLRHLNEVLVRVQQSVQDSATGGIGQHSAIVCEANRVVLTCFQAAARYRKETSDLYRIESSKVGLESWTCTADDVSLLNALVASTNALIKERTRQLGSNVDQGILEYFSEANSEAADEVEKKVQLMLKGQLCELAGHAFDVYEERLSYLAVAGAGNPSLQREHALLQTEYTVQRHEILLSLASIGRLDRAFFLAEEYHVFATLTELCSLLPSEEQRTSRLQSFLRKYGEPFAMALYRFYVESGQMQELLSQDEEYVGLLKRFLDNDASLNRVAWLHDVALHDQHSATECLLREASQEKQSSASKKLMLSLAKLSKVSALSEVQIASQKEQVAIELIDDQLDLLNVHNRIRNTFLVELSEEKDDDMDAILTVKGQREEEDGLVRAEEMVSALSEREPSHSALYLAVAGKLLANEVMTSEDLIDLLTLHDANESSMEDFALAVEVFVRDRELPPTRARSTLSSLWRRIVLFDDWQAITQTANTADTVIVARLRSTALYHTVVAAMGNQASSDAMLAIEEMLDLPSLESLQTRLTQLGVAQEKLEDISAEGLLREGQEDVETLTGLLQSANLQQWYAQVRELALEAAQQDDPIARLDMGMDTTVARSSSEDDSVMVM